MARKHREAPGEIADAPKLTKSMSIAIADLGLDELFVIYPGQRSYDLSKKVKVMPLTEIQQI